MYIIPEEINSEVKIYGNSRVPLIPKNLYIKDALILFTTIILVVLTKNIFIEMLRLPYFIFMSILAMVMVRKSRDNASKRVYESLYLFVKKDIETYHAINLRRGYDEQKRQIVEKAREAGKKGY